MGKPGQIGEISVGELILLWHYVLAQAGVLYNKAGQDLEKALDAVLVYLWSVDILSISAEQVSQPDMKVGCLLGFGKLLRIF